MTALLWVVMIIWAISALSLIALVLMHSGKGTGLSEVLSGMQGSVGTGIIEKNLNRMTVIAASFFVITLITLMFIWP